MIDEDENRVFVRKTTGETYTFLGELEVPIGGKTGICVFYARNDRMFITSKDAFYRAFKECEVKNDK